MQTGSSPAEYVVQFFYNIATNMVPDFNILEVFTQTQLTQSTVHVLRLYV